MKHRITLSIALALSIVLVSLMSSDSTVNAQPGRVFVADTGIIASPEYHMVRLTVANGLNTATLQFRRLEYTEGTCNGGVCKHVISSQTVSDPLTLAPGEAASYSLGASNPTVVRYVVTSNRQNMRVNVSIINTTTGEIEAFFDIFTE